VLYNKPNFLYRYCITEGKMAYNLPKAVQATYRKRKAIPPSPPSNDNSIKSFQSFESKQPDQKRTAIEVISLNNPIDIETYSPSPSPSQKSQQTANISQPAATFLSHHSIDYGTNNKIGSNSPANSPITLTVPQIEKFINDYIQKIRDTELDGTFAQNSEKLDGKFERVPGMYQFPVLNNIGRVIKSDPNVPKRKKLDKNNPILQWAKNKKKELDNENTDNQSVYTFPLDLKSITTAFDVSPFAPFIIMSEDLGYALNFKFKNRMELFITKDKESVIKEGKEYGSNIQNILDDDQETIRQKITSLQINKNYNEQHKKIQFFIDAIDLIHDVAYAKETDGYIAALNKIATKHGVTDFSEFTEKIINKSNATIQKEVNDMRKQKRNELIKLANENNVPIPHMEETPLTLMEGYFEFFDVMNKYNGASNVNMAYFESGRKFKYGNEFKELVKEYDDNGDNFKIDCSSYCNINIDNGNDEYNNLYEKLAQGNPYVETKPCTTIDGFGVTNKSVIPDNYQIYTFNNVFGRFNYKIHTFYVLNVWKHIIMIYDINEVINNPNPIAIFTLYGNGTIDSLLSAAGMSITRNGDGGKGGTLPFKDTITEWNKSISEITVPDTLLIEAKKDGQIFGKYSKSHEDYFQLLLLGVKTCGDLVVYQYNKDTHTSLHFVGTTDKGIAFSNEIDFLQPENDKKEVLMGVMRRDGNGWLYTKGIEKVNNKLKSEQIIIKLISYYHFLLAYDKTNNANNVMLILENAMPTGYSINLESEEKVSRFNQLKVFREETFNTIEEYSEVEISPYESCMLTILIEENKAINQSIKNCITNASTIFASYNESFSNVNFWESIVKLPNLNDAFSSKVSKIAQNHETIRNIFSEVPNNRVFKQGETDESKNSGYKYKIKGDTINVKIQANDIIIYYEIDNDIEGTTVNDVEFKIESEGESRKKKHTLKITSPITLDLLIQLLEKTNKTNETNETNKKYFIQVENPEGGYHEHDDSRKIISEEIDRIFTETLSLASLNEKQMKECQFFYKEKLKTIGYISSSETSGIPMDQSAGKRRNTTRKRRRRVTRRKGPIIPKKKKKKRHTRKGKR